MDRAQKSSPTLEQVPQNPPSAVDAGVATVPVEEIRLELQKILASRAFRAAHGQKKFLAYVVEEDIAGRAHLLKEYIIATEALGRDPSFDPRLDPIVRMEARKLRARLAKYYESEGAGNALRIELRKGSYAPFFRRPVDAVAAPLEPPAAAVEASPVAPVPEAPRSPAARLPWAIKHWKAALPLLAVLALAVSGMAYFRLVPRSPAGTVFPNDISIAVLPLVNLGDNNDDFLSEGLTDELISSLTEVPGLRVVARTSAFRFKSKTVDLRNIDEKLHVRTVLVGTVTRSQDRIRITAQLNDAANGYHLWSGNYEIGNDGIGKLPGEITTAVTAALGVSSLPNGGRAPALAIHSPNSDAQQDYLRGLYFRNKFTADSLNTAIQYYKRAIAEDPSFARAYAGLADCYAMGRPVAGARPLEEAPKIQAIASKAIELDNKLGDPHIDLAVEAEYEFDWSTAGREFKKGLELSPGNILGHIWYAWYLSLMGRTEEVLAQKTIAAELDPVSPYALDAVGHYYFTAGRYDAAIDQYRSALALEPNFGLTHQDIGDAYLFERSCGEAIKELRLANGLMPGPRRLGRLGYAYAVCGQTAEARRILEGLLAEPHPTTVPALAVAEIYLGLGIKDQAFPWLERAIDERDLEVNLKCDPRFQPLRSDSRFNSLLRRMKLN